MGRLYNSRYKKEPNSDGKFICEYCGIEHAGNYGSGRFCSSKCARKFPQSFISEEGRQRQINTLNSSESREKLAAVRLEKSLNKSKYNEPKNPIELRNKDKINLPIQMGKLGEVTTIKKFIERGIDVYIPVVDSSGADLVADFGGKLQKIQVKTSSRTRGVNKDATIFKLQRRDYSKYDDDIEYHSRGYDSSEVDYFSLYDYNQDELYLLKNNGDKKAITLRTNSPANSQKQGIHYADDYRFDRMIDIILAGVDPDDIIECDDYTLED